MAETREFDCGGGGDDATVLGSHAAGDGGDLNMRRRLLEFSRST